MATFHYPFIVTKDTPAVANEVQTNFDSLLAWIETNLVQKDGSVPFTGPIVLGPGDPASPEHATNKAYVDAQIPVGTIWEYAGTSLPDKWLWCNGDTYANTAQPALAAAIGRTYTDAGVPATSFQVPDKRKRVSVGADATETMFNLGKTGGQRDSELLGHVHGINHGHTGTIGNTNLAHTHDFSPMASAGGHTHTPTVGGGQVQASAVGTGFNTSPTGNAALTSTGLTTEGAHVHGGSTGWGLGEHNHSLTVPTTSGLNSSSTGAGTVTTDKNLQPFVTVNYIIYAGA